MTVDDSGERRMSMGDVLAGLSGAHVVRPNAEEAAGALAELLVEHLQTRLAAVEAVHLALSGGSSAKLLGPALKAKDRLSKEEWSRVHLWMVDERCVPDDDPQLNFPLIRDGVAAPLSIPTANLHAMPVLRKNGDQEYEHAISLALSVRPPSDRRLDAVVLGMGPDGHTASLFPQSPALDETERLVVFNDGERVVPPRPRMTFTYPALSSAHLIVLLVTGAGKRDALAKTAARTSNFHDWPVAGLSPSSDDRLLWFLDRDALPAP
jgi:6-phosphogluconolactonase